MQPIGHTRTIWRVLHNDTSLFEAVPSWSTMDWWSRESEGEQEQPVYICYYFELASPAAVRAWTARTGKNSVRSAASRKPRSARAPENGAGV